MIDELVARCNQAEDRLQQKVNYYFGAYGQYQDCQPILPMSYDTSDNYKENASMKWGSLAKIVLGNPQMCKSLIKSVAGDIFAKLKELSGKIHKLKFQKVLEFVNDLLKNDLANEEFQNSSELDSENDRMIKTVTDDEKKLRSLITLLFMIKKGKLEEIITIKKPEKRRRIASFASRGRYINSSKNIQPVRKYSRYFPHFGAEDKKKELKSSKIVPSLPLIEETKIVWTPNLQNIEKPRTQSRNQIQDKVVIDDQISVISTQLKVTDDLEWA